MPHPSGNPTRPPLCSLAMSSLDGIVLVPQHVFRFSQSDSKTVCQDEAAASRIDLSKLKRYMFVCLSFLTSMLLLSPYYFVC